MNRAPFTAALVRALEVGLAGLGTSGQDIEVGRDRPPGRGDTPFVILYALEGGSWIGPPSDMQGDAAFLYQTKAVAKRSADKDGTLGAEALGDIVRGIMLATVPSVPGLTVMRRYSAAVGGTQADDRVMNADERFYFLVTTS